MSDGGQARCWSEIEALLARARVVRPLHHAEALVDLGQVLAEDAGMPVAVRLAEALDGWDGRLLLALRDDALAPALRAGDRLVIDPGLEPAEGDLVLAFADGALVARILAGHGGRQWLVANAGEAIALSAAVAILGVVVETRRTPSAALRV